MDLTVIKTNLDQSAGIRRESISFDEAVEQCKKYSSCHHKDIAIVLRQGGVICTNFNSYQLDSMHQERSSRQLKELDLLGTWAANNSQLTKEAKQEIAGYVVRRVKELLS